MGHISDVLDITKYDAGKLRLRPVALNLSDLMQDIVDSQGSAAMAHNSVIEWGWADEPAQWIHADKERIQHILVNLIGNAVKFTHDGRISVELKMIPHGDAAPEIMIGVRDTGIGIDTEIQPRIFDDFVTGNTSYDRDVGGTGLGLGIARRFVEALDGQIGMESEKGVGSYFWVRFPVETIAAPEDAEVATDDNHVVKSCKILLVEDNEINRLVAREMLKKAGHVVKEAYDGNAGTQMANAEHFDLILMDISMPVMDGRAATRAIRSGGGPCATTPIVALTANALVEEQKAFLSDGMNAILTKPLSRDALAAMIRKWAKTPTSLMAQVSKSHLSELYDTIGPDAFAGLMARFVAETDALLNWIGQGRDIPAEDLRKNAHKGAGSAATFGALDLRAALLKVESAAVGGDIDAIVQACAALPSVWSATRDQLNAQPFE